VRLPRPESDCCRDTGNNAPVRGEDNNFNVTGESGLTYIWSVASGKGTILSGNNTASISARFNVVDTATLLVISRNSASCQSIASSIIVNVTPAVGLNEESAMRNLSIYPIPAKTVLNLKLEGLENGHAEVRIINMLGQVVQTKNITLSKGINMHTINVYELNKGVYLLEIQHSKNRLVKRIMVE